MSRDDFNRRLMVWLRDGWPQDPGDFAEKVLFDVGIVVETDEEERQ